MDDLRRRFATLDSVPAELDWAEVERAAAERGRAGMYAEVTPMSVARVPGPGVRLPTTRPRGLVLLVAAALVAALVAGIVGFGGLLNRSNVVVDVSPSPTTDATTNPTDDASIAPTPSDTLAPSIAAACPGVEAPLQPRITNVRLPGKTTAPLGDPVVAGCAVWVPSGENGGGIHRIDLATLKVTNANPAEVVFEVDAADGELWAIGQPLDADAIARRVLYRLDPRTGATVKELRLSDFWSSVHISEGRAWLGAFSGSVGVMDLASGELVARPDLRARYVQVGAGAVWSGLSRVDPVTFEVTDLQTTFPANEVVFAADRMYGIDLEHGEVAQLDPVTGSVLTSVRIENWSAGIVAVERGSIWILQYSEPPAQPLKLRKTNLVRIDATTGEIAERIPFEVVAPVGLYATDGNLWIVDQPTRLRHGFIRIELPAP